jgi:1-acyl-sn-glycerol-3-phosphate acyltransferase
MSSSSSAQFLPPKLNPVFTRIVQSLTPALSYWGYRLQLKVAAEDIEKIKAIERERIVYLPNHPTLDDGIPVFLLSARLGQLFHYIIAYESFKGLLGKFLQRIGAYSIRRGVGDRASVVQTLKLLQQPACKLVIFPEGGCSYQNDTVIPFRSGAVELSLKALAQLAKHEATIPNFYLVPVSLKYRYTTSMNSAIEQTLQKLETALDIESTHTDSYQRLRSISHRVLSNLEAEYQLQCNRESLDWNQRIAELKIRVLEWCETELDLIPNPQLPIRERVYKIQATLESLNCNSDKISETIYHQIARATVRLLNFDAIYDGYVAAEPTPERFLDTLNRLEREVFNVDRPALKGHRHAYLRLGDPLNLKDYFSLDRQDREMTAISLTQQIQQIVQTNLELDNSD